MRRYFDFCDRLALRRLLPKEGDKFVDVCGGFGRLADEYMGRFNEVFLFDQAPNLLAQAQAVRGVHTPPFRAIIKGMYPEENTLPKQHTPSLQGVVDFLLDFN